MSKTDFLENMKVTIDVKRKQLKSELSFENKIKVSLFNIQMKLTTRIDKCLTFSYTSKH